MHRKSVRRIEALLAVLLFFSFAYFHHSAPGWNVNSRLALTYAIVEHGTLHIDDYVRNLETQTMDIADYGGHHYSDKVIGTSLLGVPAFTALRVVEELQGYPFSWATRRYVTTLFSVGLMAVLGAILLFRLTMLEAQTSLVDNGARAAAAITFFMFLGTQFFFSTRRCSCPMHQR